MMDMMDFMANRILVFAPFMIIWFLVAIAWIALLIWAIIDLAKSKKDAMTKIFWLFVITLVGNLKYSWIGVLIYYFFGREKGKK